MTWIILYCCQTRIPNSALQWRFSIEIWIHKFRNDEIVSKILSVHFPIAVTGGTSFNVNGSQMKPRLLLSWQCAGYLLMYVINYNLWETRSKRLRKLAASIWRESKFLPRHLRRTCRWGIIITARISSYFPVNFDTKFVEIADLLGQFHYTPFSLFLSFCK